MKKGVKYLIAALSLALLLCVCALVDNAAAARRHLVTCNNVEIRLRDTLNLLAEDDIRAFLDRSCPALIGQRIDSIRLYQLEKTLETRSAVRTAEAWTTADGVLHIDITQRDPAARLVYGTDSFYIDATGFVFPMQGNCRKSIPVFEWTVTPDDPAQEPLLELVTYMERHHLTGRFPTVRVEKDGELVLIPAEGKERFIFGKPERLQEKFAAIADYYKKITGSREDVAYRTVNVKYRGQIICRK